MFARRPFVINVVLVVLTVVLTGCTMVQAAELDRPALFPEIADTTHASPQAAELFHSYFTAKSQHDPVTTMAHFSVEKLTYIDAALGWPFGSHDALADLFRTYMPQWPESGLSYATRILGDENSALVAFTDTPELFGSEIRILAAIDLENGKIVRWVDYWDGRHFGTELAAQLRTPAEQFPTDLGEVTVTRTTAAPILDAANNLHTAITNQNAAAAAQLFSEDAVYEDMTLRTQILGRLAIERYLERVLTEVPYGVGSTLAHIVGGEMGGGYEWKAAPAYQDTVRHGITALELDANGKITRLTTVWDGAMIADEQIAALMLLSLE
jgi:hypothetical protein